MRQTQGALLRAKRIRLGASLATMAARIGVSRAAVSLYETDRIIIPSRRLADVARAYGLRALDIATASMRTTRRLA